MLQLLSKQGMMKLPCASEFLQALLVGNLDNRSNRKLCAVGSSCFAHHLHSNRYEVCRCRYDRGQPPPYSSSSHSSYRSICRISSLRPSARTVARPTGVKPRISIPSGLNAPIRTEKWIAHSSFRGWKSGAIWPVSGSTPARLGPFFRLHCQQASARLSSCVDPPCCLATMCSMWKGRGNAACGTRQYSQSCPARRRTAAANSVMPAAAGVDGLSIATRPEDRRY